MGTQNSKGGDHAWYTVTDDVRGTTEVPVEPRLGAEGVVVFICWMLLNPDEPKDRPLDEFLAQAPGTPATKDTTNNKGRSFFMETIYRQWIEKPRVKGEARGEGRAPESSNWGFPRFGGRPSFDGQDR